MRPKDGKQKDNGSDPAKQDAPEFQRFEDLARKLVQVPKKELDALRKKKR